MLQLNMVVAPAHIKINRSKMKETNGFPPTISLSVRPCFIHCANRKWRWRLNYLSSEPVVESNYLTFQPCSILARMAANLDVLYSGI